ncbi:hypothetical protein BGZ96_000948 [Linnemannia gamsii]|uniref:Biogenesis of lysosome-related organelles complex 1 subunit 7 n=1 Tax=Linnemannia gamsii TaxID=64522 RepID=A0ABQ7JNC5_9FUNG|nr:hypothetical protein BGZ96_000948 [Linnemannia gamsii]
MDESPEHLMSQALLEKLEPLIHTIESQLRDLGQGQVILQGNVAQLSSELNMTQAELDKIHDTFARLPHYIAKLTAMKNTIATVSVMSRKLKRRVEQVTIGREKQNNKAQAARAREQAYDQTIAAVRSRTSGPAASTSTEPQTPSSFAAGIAGLVGTAGTAGTAGTTGGPSSGQAVPSLSPQSRPTISMPSIRLPFPLPAKPAFPIVSTSRSSSGTGSPPPSSSQRLSPMLSGRGMETSTVTSTGELGPEQASEQADSNSNSPQEPLVDRFPQISSTTDDTLKAVGSSMEVEVVRLRRKKKAGSKSSASSVASTGTTGSKKGQAGKSTKVGPGTPCASSPQI